MVTFQVGAEDECARDSRRRTLDPSIENSKDKSDATQNPRLPILICSHLRIEGEGYGGGVKRFGNCGLDLGHDSGECI